MINYLKKHLIIISFLLLLGSFLFSFGKVAKELKTLENSYYENRYKMCINSNYEPSCSRYDENGTCLEYSDYCTYFNENINNKNKMTYDTMTYYEKTNFYTSQFAPLFLLLISSILFAYELFKSKTIINIIQRKGYKATMKQVILKCYRYIWLLPLISIVLLFICFLASGHFDYSFVERTRGFAYFDYSMNLILYYILLLIYMLLISIFFINLGLITLRKNHNFIIVLIETLLIYYGIDILTETLIGNMLSYEVYGYASYFSILNTIELLAPKDIIYYVIYMFILAFISFAIVIMMYRNKEKFLIDCEKN